MGNVKNNLGAQRTREAIEKSFLELSNELPLQKITVAKIVERSRISRGTFYLHYHDVYELAKCVSEHALHELETEIARCLDARLDEKKSEGEELGNEEGEEEFPALRILFEYVLEHQEEAGFIFSDNAPAGTRQKAMGLISRFCNEAVEQRYGTLPAENKNLFNAYVGAGLFGLLENWVAQGCSTSPLRMADAAGALIVKGVQGLFELDD